MVVERLHPEVIHLEVPELAGWQAGLDHHGFVVGELPVAVVVGDVGVTARSLEHALVAQGQRVVMFTLEVCCPVGEQLHRIFSVAGCGHELAHEGLGVERWRGAGAAEALDVQLCGVLAAPVVEGLTDEEQIAVGLHRQPVS